VKPRLKGDGEERLDLRLLPGVAMAWLCAWLAPLLPIPVAIATVCALALAALLRFSPWLRISLAVGSVVVLVVMLRVVAIAHGPVDDLASQHRLVTIEATLTSDPRFSKGTSFGALPNEQVRVDLRVSEVSTYEGQWRVRTPVVAIGDSAGWREPRFGQTVQVRGQLSPAGSAEPIAALLFTSDPPQLLSSGPAPLQVSEQMRQGLHDAAASTRPGAAGLLPALVVGDTSSLTSQLEQDLRDSGLAHLTAVSGANVAIVLVSVLFVARWMRVRSYWLVSTGLVAVGWFVLLARPQPSVVRAAVMGSLGIIAVMSAGRRGGPRLLLAAALVLLLADPWLARSWGFSLSVAATAGLLFLATRWRVTFARRMPQLVADGLAVALAAQIATIPLSVALAGQVALLSVPANLLAAPAVPPATVLGAAAAAIAPIAPLVSEWLVWLAQWPTEWIAIVAQRTAQTSIATIPWPDSYVGGLLATIVILTSSLVVRWLRRRDMLRALHVGIAMVVALCLLLGFVLGPGRWPPRGWVVVACDVGQGDGLVVNAGEGVAMVVDVGPDPVLMDRCLEQLGVESIPILVLTHPHADHVMGLPAVLEDRDVDTLLVSPLTEPAEQVEAIDRWAGDIPQVIATPGQHGVLGDIQWEVIGPVRVIRGEGSDPNNASVVLRLEVRGITLLLTGDIEPAAQRALVTEGIDLRADVLKVPHHGSADQDYTFWQAVQPAVALVSAGEDNTYGHPDPELLEALAQANVVVGRTDVDGAVAVVAQEETIRMSFRS